MSLHALKREYEERKQALVEKLQRDSNLDAATQHQIYGAIKEIENFLRTLDAQMTSDQNMEMDLSTDRPRPFERTRNVFRKVGDGTKRVFTERIPRATKRIVTAPKQYVDKRREMARLRKEIEAELRARHIKETMRPEEHVQQSPSGLSGTVTSVDAYNTSELETSITVQRQVLDDTLPPQDIPERTVKRKAKKHAAKTRAKNAHRRHKAQHRTAKKKR